MLLITNNKKKLDIAKILQRASEDWDGGYAMAGLLGHGDAFALRDPAAIRPAYYYQNDEVVVVASERPVIQTAFNVPAESIQEIERGHAFIIKKDGNTAMLPFTPQLERKACSFERIYFSRGNDASIYKERLSLGKRVFPKVLDAINNDVKNTVFSFIPNTAEIAFYGLTESLQKSFNDQSSI